MTADYGDYLAILLDAYRGYTIFVTSLMRVTPVRPRR